MQNEIIPVIVKVRSSNAGVDDSIEMTCSDGVLRNTVDGIALRYQETMFEDGNDNTMTQTVIIFASSRKVAMNRIGEYGSSMVFEKGKPFMCNYKTPFGTLQIEVETQKLQVRTEKNEGEILLQYKLTMQGNPPLFHNISVSYYKK